MTNEIASQTGANSLDYRVANERLLQVSRNRDSQQPIGENHAQQKQT